MTSPTVRTILYVEDHEPNVFLVEAIFSSRADIRVITAATGSAGLRFAEEHRPDVVLLDLHLPDMRGEQFLQQMREISHLAKTPVIVLTADVACDPSGKLSVLGIAEFISKPFDISHLERTVDKWLGNGSNTK